MRYSTVPLTEDVTSKVMKKLFAIWIPIFCALALLAAEPKVPAMPDAVTQNAVASLKNGLEVYSMMGIGTKKTWESITNQMFMLKLSSGKWIEDKPVPGVAGRLGASAVGVKGQVFVFGGYVVDGQGNELTVGDVNFAVNVIACPTLDGFTDEVSAAALVVCSTV